MPANPVGERKLSVCLMRLRLVAKHFNSISLWIPSAILMRRYPLHFDLAMLRRWASDLVPTPRAPRPIHVRHCRLLLSRACTENRL